MLKSAFALGVAAVLALSPSLVGASDSPREAPGQVVVGTVHPMDFGCGAGQHHVGPGAVLHRPLLGARCRGPDQLLSGLDSETVYWRHDRVDLAATIGPIEEAIRPLLNGRRLTFEVDRPGAAVPVLGDRAQLERVMINLLSNAVKFTEDGGTIGFGVAVTGDHAVITVRDTGIGIPTDEQGDLFQRFFRSSTAQVRQIQGTGLGLSIVAAIVSGHGGTIEVRSGHLQGSTFTVRLPLAKSERLTHAG